MVPAPTPARSAMCGTGVPWKPRSTNRSSAAAMMASRLSVFGDRTDGSGRAGGAKRSSPLLVLRCFAGPAMRNEYSFRGRFAKEVFSVFLKITVIQGKYEVLAGGARDGYHAPDVQRDPHRQGDDREEESRSSIRTGRSGARAHADLRRLRADVPRQGRDGAEALPAVRPRVLRGERQGEARHHAEAMAGIEQRARHQRLLRIGLVVACGLCIGFVKYQMKKQIREDNAMMDRASYSPLALDTPYSYELSHFASDMCGCQDIACARDVERRFTVWSRTPEGTPSSDDTTDASEQELQRYGDCMGKLEASH